MIEIKVVTAILLWAETRVLEENPPRDHKNQIKSSPHWQEALALTNVPASLLSQ